MSINCPKCNATPWKVVECLPAFSYFNCGSHGSTADDFEQSERCRIAELESQLAKTRAERDALRVEVGALADHLHDASPSIPITRNDIDRLVKAVTRPKQPQPCPHGCYPVNGHLRCEPCATGMEE